MLRIIRGNKPKNSRKLTATKAVILLLAVDALLFGLRPSFNNVEAAVPKKSTRSSKNTKNTKKSPPPSSEDSSVIPGVVNEDSDEIVNVNSSLESRERTAPRKKSVVAAPKVAPAAPQAIQAQSGAEEVDEVLPDPLSEAPSEIAAREEREAAAKPMMVAKAETKKPPMEDYDIVPKGQIGRVAQRFEIVERILKNYGRAYDYKEYTLTQLKEIESQLERIYGASPTTDF
jgi:hypothetical protein